MGLDIYAGTLTRYYSRDWKNLVQQQAEENGFKYETIGGDGNEIQSTVDHAEIEQIHDAINQWSSNLIERITPSSPTTVWNEGVGCHYFTDRPDWLAYGALIMLQACQHFNSPLPEYVDSDWNAYDEPIVKKAMSQETANSLLMDVCFWVPIQEKAIFGTVMPTGDEMLVSTVELLKQELEKLNQQIWKADEATILSWATDKYYIPIVEQKVSKRFLGLISRKSETVKFRTEELAQCAYSMLYKAVGFASEHHVSIVLDF